MEYVDAALPAPMVPVRPVGQFPILLPVCPPEGWGILRITDPADPDGFPLLETSAMPMHQCIRQAERLLPGEKPGARAEFFTGANAAQEVRQVGAFHAFTPRQARKERKANRW